MLLRLKVLGAAAALFLVSDTSLAQPRGGGKGGGGHPGGGHPGGGAARAGFPAGGGYRAVPHGGSYHYGGYRSVPYYGGYRAYSVPYYRSAGLGYPYYGGYYGNPYSYGSYWPYRGFSISLGLGGLGYGYGYPYSGYGYPYYSYGLYSAPTYSYSGGSTYPLYLSGGSDFSIPQAVPAVLGYPAIAGIDSGSSTPRPGETVSGPKEPAPAKVTLIVPDGTQVWFNGEDTGKTGGSQVFTSEPIDPGKTVNLSIKARWDGKARQMQLPMRAGDKMTVDMRGQ